jgi:serine protease
MWFTAIMTAAASGWQLDPSAPPVSMGGGAHRYADGVVLHTLPAVVLALTPGTEPPPDAQWLGGRSWRVPTSSSEEAIALTLLLQEQRGVEAAFPDVVLHRRTTGMFTDPGYEGQWYLEELGAERLFSHSLGDPSIAVAVLDSGIDIAHIDLADAVSAPYDAWSDDSDPSPNDGEFCYGGGGICDEHGTAVSGVIVARAGNEAGIVGLCPECTLIPIKLLGEGTGALSADVAAFEHAIAQDAAVINNSWGFTTAIRVPTPLAAVIDRAATEPRGGLGAVVVFAAGNDDRTIRDDELQALDSVLCVSATDRYGQPTAYTNQGSSVDIAAPSATVTIAPGDEIMTTFGGTSAAAPVVSGVAAWLLSVRPDLSAQEVRDILTSSAIPSPLVTHDSDGHHPIYGYGELDLDGVIAAAYGEDVDTGLESGGCGCSTRRAAGGGFGVLLLCGLWLTSRRRR